MLKNKKAATTGATCSSTTSGYKCALTGDHEVHCNSEKRTGQYMTWTPLDGGRFQVQIYNGKKKGESWVDEAPPAPVAVSFISPETAASVPDLNISSIGFAGEGEDDDPFEEEVRSDADRDLARKMREDREAHARELEQAEAKKPAKKKVSKIYTAAEREAIERKEAQAAPPTAPLERIGDHEVHPVATKFRMIGTISEDDFAAFREDIRVNGQRDQVIRVAYEGKRVILDGRNRLRACLDLGIEPRFRDFGSEPGDGDDPIKYVLSKNVYRRHEDPTSLAYLAAELVPMYETQARERQRLAGGDRKSLSANLRGAIDGETSKATEAAAKAMNVSARSVEAALQVKRDAAPEVLAVKDRMAVSAAAKLAKLPKAKQREIVEKLGKGTVKPGKVTSLVNQEKKRAVVRKINEQKVAPAPLGPFGLIVIDPPWPYDNSDQHEGSRGHIDYPPMSMNDICALRSVLDPRAKEDCILGLWITNAFMHELGRVLEAWGFTHRTVITWDKVRAGVGTLPRGQTEHLVIATRGVPVHTLSEVTTLLSVPRREHSRKPDEMYALLAEHCSGPMIDMFSREARDGWATWGAETSKFTEAA